MARRINSQKPKDNHRQDKAEAPKSTKAQGSKPKTNNTRIDIIPRTKPQETLVNKLYDDEVNYVLATGAAGTGKSLLATLYAIKEFKAGKYERIVITRPAVSVDEEHGFLPGTLIEKLMPWCRPIIDVLREYFEMSELLYMFEEEIIELAPLAYMRGRNLKNSVIIFDEAQNSLPSQMKMMLTRLAEGSKMIITGDIEQHDRGFEENGLADFISRLEENPSNRVAVVNFSSKDSQRHPAISQILDLYQDVK
jgi:phosphate starvation-inducible PhoH-like protein